MVEQFDVERARRNLEERVPGSDPDLVLAFLGCFRLGKLLERDAQQILRTDNLETSDHQVLVTLWLNGPDQPLSQTELSDRIIQTTGGMTKTVRRLERAGLVERRPHPSIARVKLVQLTGAGERLARSHFHERFDRWSERFARATSGDARTLAQLVWQLMSDATFPATTDAPLRSTT